MANAWHLGRWLCGNLSLEEVRECRRRDRKRGWQTAPIARLFTTTNEVEAVKKGINVFTLVSLECLKFHHGCKATFVSKLRVAGR